MLIVSKLVSRAALWLDWTVGWHVGIQTVAVWSQWVSYASPHLWNQLPSSFRQPHCVHSPPGSPHPTYISPHHSHHLRSYHLSLPPPFTPDLKLLCFTNPFLHSHSYSFRTDFTDLNLYCIKGALAVFVLVFFLATCAR